MAFLDDLALFIESSALSPVKCSECKHASGRPQTLAWQGFMFHVLLEDLDFLYGTPKKLKRQFACSSV